MSKRTIRAGQLIAPFGPGAVIDLGSESFCCTDITHWSAGGCIPIRNNPLEPVLHKKVRVPPREASLGEIPVVRFPRWMFCPSCRRLYFWDFSQEEANDRGEPKCRASKCKSATLTPMRFVAACEQGHLQDVDWFRWAHRNKQASKTGQCNRATAKLYFRTTGASGGDFNAMSVFCSSCGENNSLVGLTRGPYIFGCAGRQPWQQQREAEVCQERPRVFPRAASSVYYPETRSAIDLEAVEKDAGPMPLKRLRDWLDRNVTVLALRNLRSAFVGKAIPAEVYQDLAPQIMEEFGVAEEQALSELALAIARDGPTSPEPDGGNGGVDTSQHGILTREWDCLSRSSGIRTENLRTSVLQLVEHWPPEYSQVFEQVTLIERLREVRALIGFRRVKPDKTSRLVPVSPGNGADWLPGVESFGEGIFVKFREETLANWEREVGQTYEATSRRLLEACDRWGREPAAVHASPRFIALHTFAHGFIRRLAFDAGYSAASIRERVYCDLGARAAGGVMLYTAEGDSEGSLGGLVRQGQPDRLLATVRRTLADLTWCSADPVCSELEEQGVDGMNSAACHACCLVSETSCTYNNCLLDRRLLVGGGGLPGMMAGLLGTGK